ncbi:MAG: hypothetical protein HYR60_30835 [Acidobacteria bacterium]|nr:hypothetical protein [Acidobacteriota bacterium]MBI3472399.1 hypothetical protein [Candidatus Solibacter usitatus]
MVPLTRFGLAAVLALGLPALAQTPVVGENGVVNAASAGRDAPAPGSLVSIFGTNLASDLARADTVPLSAALNNVSVTINNLAAPLLFVSAGQINAQVPWDALPADSDSGTGTVVVTRNGLSSDPRTFSLQRFSPLVYTLSSVAAPAATLALAVNNDDGTVAQLENAIPGIKSKPAKPGGVLVIYASGLGPVDPPIATGAVPGSGDKRPATTTPVVLIGDQQAEVMFAGLAPDFAGVYQVNVTIPAAVTPGNAVSLRVRIGEATSAASVTIAVRN